MKNQPECVSMNTFCMRLAIVFILSSLGITQVAFSQTDYSPVASIINGAIQIDETVDLQYSYYLDISNMDFESEEAAKNHFSAFNSPESTFTVLFDEAILRIDLEMRRSNWTASEWNQYLSETTGSN